MDAEAALAYLVGALLGAALALAVQVALVVLAVKLYARLRGREARVGWREALVLALLLIPLRLLVEAALPHGPAAALAVLLLWLPAFYALFWRQVFADSG